ncbi:MAG: hypothetical protein JWN38_220 [Candidatus Saccharibacteria bacterium]|nr:hypothetical protein [Candidatus Saccharibacteria bacterium]
MMPKMTKEKILIVGGGFGGVKTALELADDSRFQIILLSDQTDFRYYPTLYRTATGGSRANSSITLHNLFLGKGVEVVQGSAQTLDRKAKSITTTEGKVYNYDTLVLALGVVTNYFGIPGLQEFSYSIKSQVEVARFKAHLHKQLIDDRRPDLNYVVIGAGPTGIELASELPTYLRRVMRNHGLPQKKVHIDLIEASPTLLPRMPADVGRTITRRLKKLGIKIYTNSIVQGATADDLMVSGKPIRSHTIVWTAGVTNHPFFTDNHFVVMGRGKVAVDTFLQAEDGIFVIGDNANTPYSGLAQTALRDAISVAGNIKRRASHKDMKSYKAKRPVSVIPGGPQWAAVQWGNIHFSGKLGWALREAADFIGFKDLEPWRGATKQWLTTFGHEDDCEVCTIAEASRRR